MNPDDDLSHMANTYTALLVLLNNPHGVALTMRVDHASGQLVYTCRTKDGSYVGATLHEAVMKAAKESI